MQFLNQMLILVNWIDPGKTLREQGIDEAETVLLRRKFFYSDQNIDSRDPVQLNLLYVQARDAILDGTHPVTEAKGLCNLFLKYYLLFLYVQYMFEICAYKLKKNYSNL